MLRRSLPILFAVLVCVGVPVGAGAAVATTVPDAAQTTPAPTDPPPATEAPAGPATTAPATPEPDDGSSTDWLPIVLIIGGIVALLVVLVALLGRNKQPAPAPAAHTPRPPTAPSPQANLLSTAQWIHDQLTLELMAAAPATAVQRWATERSRLDNVAIGAQQEFAAGNDPNWQPLGQTMSSLAVAIDTNLTLRGQQPPNAQLIGESNDVVNRNRATLQQLIYLLRPTITR